MFLSVLRRSRTTRILDGGMGVLLPKLGVPKDPIVWSARALIEERYHPLVVKAHKQYIEAGATAIITNSYAVIPGYLRKASLEADAPRLCTLAGQLARDAAGPKGQGEIVVLGSLPPLMESYRADLLVETSEAIKWYAMMAEAMAPFVDAFVCETMSCPEEAACALQGMREGAPDGKAWVCFTVDSEGKCRDGTPFNDAVRSLSSASNVSGIGVNCCMPEAVPLAIAALETDAEAFEFATHVERIVYPNAYPKEHSEGHEYNTENFDDEAVRVDMTIDTFASDAVRWASHGALPFTVIGGCCGIGPSHIQRMAAAVNSE